MLKQMGTEELKALVINEIDARRGQLIDLSLKIHANPELAFKEIKAAEWLSDYLGNHGFTLERGICDLGTAFRASFGQGEPAIAILAEYDALPEIGHACGHNLIATIAAGAGVAARLAVERLGGRVLVIGTPAEETYGGKALMVERGAFNGVDMAMMVHPGVADAALVHSLACQGLKVEFFGKAAHAAARPEQGINALEAMIQSFNGINALRQHIRDKARIHGIITHGGEAANIVPAYTSASFIIRAEEDGYLAELKDRVLNCFIGAAMATGARLEHKWGEVCYAAMLNNLVMAKLFNCNMKKLGREMSLNQGGNFGSTDMGNISRVMPSIHPIVAIALSDVSVHSPEFAQAAKSEGGLRGLLDGAKALAMTIIDLLADKELVAAVKDEFRQAIG